MEPENCKKEAKTQGDLNTFTGEWKVLQRYVLHSFYVILFMFDFSFYSVFGN